MRIQFRIKAGDAEKRERRGERVGGGVELTGKCYAGSVLCRLLTQQWSMQCMHGL